MGAAIRVPPAAPVPWRLTRFVRRDENGVGREFGTSVLDGIAPVVAKTWFEARASFARELHAEPGDIDVDMVSP